MFCFVWGYFLSFKLLQYGKLLLITIYQLYYSRKVVLTSDDASHYNIESGVLNKLILMIFSSWCMLLNSFKGLFTRFEKSDHVSTYKNLLYRDFRVGKVHDHMNGP